MKNVISLFFIGVLMIFVSCDSSQNSNYSLGPKSQVTLVKFSNSEYVNNLIVNDYKNWEKFVLMRGNNCSPSYDKNFNHRDWSYPFPGLEGRKPYIELVDGWYLIDWSWGGYPYNGKTLLTDVNWDNYNGEVFFDRSMPHVSNNSFKKKYIYIADLVAYSYPDGNYPKYPILQYNESKGIDTIAYYNEFLYFETLMGGRIMSGTPFLFNTVYCLCERVEEMDALWELLRQQIIAVINNGDLNHLPSASDEQILQLLEGYY